MIFNNNDLHQIRLMTRINIDLPLVSYVSHERDIRGIRGSLPDYPNLEARWNDGLGTTPR
jgi:hypothetical protein